MVLVIHLGKEGHDRHTPCPAVVQGHPCAIQGEHLVVSSRGREASHRPYSRSFFCWHDSKENNTETYHSQDCQLLLNNIR